MHNLPIDLADAIDTQSLDKAHLDSELLLLNKQLVDYQNLLQEEAEAKRKKKLYGSSQVFDPTLPADAKALIIASGGITPFEKAFVEMQASLVEGTHNMLADIDEP